MDFLHKPSRLIITGRSGTGKTEFFIRYVEAVKEKYDRICIYDHETEFAQRTGEPICATLDDLRRERKVECYDYSNLYPGDLQTGIEFYGDLCFERAATTSRHTIFAVDEFQKVNSTDGISHELACIIETGRRYKIDTIFVTQQINLLHNRIRNQATEVCTFRQNDKRAIQWLEEFGFHEQEIRSLQSGQFICLKDTGISTRGNIFGSGSVICTSAHMSESGIDTVPGSDSNDHEMSDNAEDLEVSRVT